MSCFFLLMSSPILLDRISTVFIDFMVGMARLVGRIFLVRKE
nr:MAG TPA: hypothetical protein [Siphoviridae sp. ct7JV2]